MKLKIYSVVTIVVLLTMTLAELSFAGRPNFRQRHAKVDKTAVQNQFTMTGNNWAFEMTNYGPYAQDVGGRLPDAGGAGGEFPRGTKVYVIFAAGIQIGALVNGVPTVSVVDFDSEFQPGALTKSDPRDSTEVPQATDPGSADNKLFALYSDGSDGTPIGTNGDATDDYANWPGQYGAPVKADGTPLIIGDLMSWSVYNDMDPALHRIPDDSNQDPLGLEVQQASIQVNITGYSDVFFMYYKIINKGTKNLNDVYIAAWFDADVDNAGNDLVATDTSSSMVFTYNADNSDPISGGGSAYGADFFQGPVVPGEETDTAKYLELTQDGFVQHVVPGKKTMGLSTTVRYINVRGPEGDPENDVELYNLMRGLEKDGTPKASRFTYPEDPVTGNPSNLDPLPNDKRMMLCTGPFNLAVGDTQIVVLGCVGGKGSDNMDAIEYLRTTDLIAQQAYDAKFLLPQPPPSPNLTAIAFDGKVALQWDNSPEIAEDHYPELANLTIPNYRTRDFAGYKVYRSPDGTVGSWELLAQFDKADGITVIPETTWVVQDSLINTLRRIPIGDDKGLHYTYVDDDVTNEQTYYYAVTSYDAQPDIRSGAAPITLESTQSRNAVKAVPRKPTLGNVVAATAQDTADHVGKSDGAVYTTVVDPTKVTGHTYKVIFDSVTVIDTVALDTTKLLVWKLWDEDLGDFVQFNKADDPNTEVDESYYQVNQGSVLDVSTQNEFAVVDGIQFRVFGPAPDFKNFLVVSNGSGALDPPDYGAFAFNSSGFPHPTTDEAPSDNQQIGGGHWGIHTGDNGARSSYDAFIDRTTRSGDNWAEIIPYDFEIRFTAAGGYGFDAYVSGTTAIQVPFELWNIGIGTPDDQSDDYRLVPWLLDDDGDAQFGMSPTPDTLRAAGTVDHSISGGLNDPYTDWIYWQKPTDDSPGQAGYLASEAEMIGNTYDGSRDETEVMARMVLVNWNGDTSTSEINPPPSGLYNQAIPEVGTTFRILSAKPNALSDTFTIRTTANPSFNASMASGQLDKYHIKVVPNPYYGFSSYDQNQFNRRVKITGLPDKCTIRIFNVAGDLVKSIAHDGTSSNDRSDSDT
ncbi:MAG: hypothetical protein EPO24_09100, partial [Bacteroidetes bacterium]